MEGARRTAGAKGRALRTGLHGLRSRAPASTPNSASRSNRQAALSLDLQWAEPWFGVENRPDRLPGRRHRRERRSRRRERPLQTSPRNAGRSRSAWTNETAAPQTVRLVIARCSGATATRRRAPPPTRGSSSRSSRTAAASSGDRVPEIGRRRRGRAGRSTATAARPSRRRSARSTSPKAPRRKRPSPTPRAVPSPTTSGRSNGDARRSAGRARKSIQKPDLTATDCASTTFFAQLSQRRLALLRQLGGRRARRHGRRADAADRTVRDAEQDRLRDASRRRPNSPTRQLARGGRGGDGERAGRDDRARRHEGRRPAEPRRPLARRRRKGAGADGDDHQGPEAARQRKPPDLRIHREPPGRLHLPGRRRHGRSAAPRPSSSRRRSATASTASSSPPPTRRAAAARAAPTASPSTPRRRRRRSSSHPKKVVKTRKRSVVGHFRLKANESPVTFYCQIDKEPLRICTRIPATASARAGTWSG